MSLNALHHLSPDQCLDQLEVNKNRGLSAASIVERQNKWGFNRLPKPEKRSLVLAFFGQFTSPLVLALLGSAVISVGVGATSQETGLLSRYGDAIAISIIVVLNACLGFFQEQRAEATLAALEKLAAPSARVLRDGEQQSVEAEQLVPGDIVLLDTGDAIPADLRLLDSHDMSVDESSLTGESVPVQKDARSILPEETPVADRVCMAFLGTTVVRGKGIGVVVSTGQHTEFGKIGAMLNQEREQTPLAAKLESFGQKLLYLCLALSAVLFVWGSVKPWIIAGAEHRGWNLLLLEAVSLAVAAIPEGLPAITSIALALGMQRMAKLGAIVRRLPAVETLGAATVICSDKTGTLTQNRMVVQRVFVAGVMLEVEGEGYDPKGVLRKALNSEFQLSSSSDVNEQLWQPILHQLLDTCTLCNDATLVEQSPGQWSVLGDPTEGALLVLSARAGHTKPDVVKVKEIPFDSDRKRMTVITRSENLGAVTHVKGALDILLPRCSTIVTPEGEKTLDDSWRKELMTIAEQMSNRALRVLALCQRMGEHTDENDLALVGLVGMLDPLKSGVREAVKDCQAAGVRVVMITGDHVTTAAALARDAGITDDPSALITGAELLALDDDSLAKRIEHVRVCARTTAQQKLRIVEALKKNDHVVAMTGDGVNDAPALRAAHIGVAMGKSGTDVARQAADLVLLDDNFSTIVAAIREGRAIYHNIKKSIVFLLSSNLGLCIAVFAVAIGDDWLPLTPLMILWINLVTNGLPALALGVDPPTPHQMATAPRKLGGGLLSKRDMWWMILPGVFMGITALLAYEITPHELNSLGEQRVRSVAFSVLALTPLLHSWACRSSTRSSFALRPFLPVVLLAAALLSALVHGSAVLVPFLNPVFRTYFPTPVEWVYMFALTVVILPLDELSKWILRAIFEHKTTESSAR